MPKNKQQLSQSKRRKPFICRLCRKPHPLRTCRKFLNMNTSERKDVVKKYGYCQNCLAHSHSEGSCFTKTGCKYCHKKHHSLLHMHPRLCHRPQGSTPVKNSPRILSPKTSAQQPSKLKPALSGQSPSTLNTSKLIDSTSLTALLRQNAVSLLPTALVKIETKRVKHYARCLLDTGSRVSCISKSFVDRLKLVTLELDEEMICPVTLWSCVDKQNKLETFLKVNNRISTRTPSEDLPEQVRSHFQHLVLADKNFYKSSSIDIILGVDTYARIVCDGTSARVGLPCTQNTIFGVVLYGNVSV